MSVVLYRKDFGVGVSDAAVIRSDQHTVLVVDDAATPRQVLQHIQDKLSDTEIEELDGFPVITARSAHHGATITPIRPLARLHPRVESARGDDLSGYSA